MKTIYFASVCGAILLAVTSFANAQGTGVSSSSDQGVTPKQCWDVSINIVREKNPRHRIYPLGGDYADYYFQWQIDDRQIVVIGQGDLNTLEGAKVSKGPVPN